MGRVWYAEDTLTAGVQNEMVRPTRDVRSTLKEVFQIRRSPGKLAEPEASLNQIQAQWAMGETEAERAARFPHRPGRKHSSQKPNRLCWEPRGTAASATV